MRDEGGLSSTFPPHDLRAGCFGYLTRPVLLYKEEGASCDPLRGSAYAVVVYYDLAAKWGCYPWLRWCVDTKGAPTAYLQGIRRTCGLTRLPPLRGYPFTRWYLRLEIGNTSFVPITAPHERVA